MYAFLPGTLLGVIAGTLGGLAGWLAPQGKAKGFIMGSFWTMLGASVVMLVLGIVGYFMHQPYGVWYGLGLAGLIGVLALGINAPALAKRYRQAEERRMQAQDMS
jgi:hypothetical protein